ncbi:probable E3 ubiquitin-protein ligase bre1 isoform X1 [Zingiber officinale]|uniref:probable E3 ubiquitin-protein ligase bre1 isoform X1 n=1 Tax=Zingiber officinale TaxID=94328 RepID=UPI001C4D5960|nr:probable E3 ubiquitin-protein ligase bre1 isoform X1 [Zingiber officinale]
MNRSRPSSVTLQDLELRLGSSVFKGGMLASNFNRGCPEIILIEDDDNDDDDMQIYTSGPPDQSFRASQYSSHWESVIDEEDLELHLGIRTSRNLNSNRQDAKIQDPNAQKSRKASSSHHPYGYDEVKLRCSICMDTMKEETSTTCGHIFCNSCITNAIQVHHRCPTCRFSLSLNSIHRIYLPGASS